MVRSSFDLRGNELAGRSIQRLLPACACTSGDFFPAFKGYGDNQVTGNARQEQNDPSGWRWQAHGNSHL